MATITKTIGTASTIDTETPASCSGSDPYTVTFVNDPTGVVVGDKAYITDEASYYDEFVYNVTGISGSSYTLTYVSGGYGAESPCSLYNSSYEQAAAVFKRAPDYATPRAWAADLDDASIYSNGDDAVGEITVNEKYDEGISIANGSTVTLNSVKLTVASSVRHNGTAGTGAGFKYTGQSSSGGGAALAQVVDIKDADNVTLEWLEFDGTGAVTTRIHYFITDHGNFTKNNTVRNNLMHGFELNSGGSVVNMILLTTSTSSLASGESHYIMNNIIYGNVHTTIAGGSPTAIYADAGRAANPIYVYNNTVNDITTRTTSDVAFGIKVTQYAVVINNIVSDVSGSATTNDCFASIGGTWSASSDFNLSTDTTAPGSNSVTSATLANIYESDSGTVNLHLKSGSPAIDAGTDLGTSPTGVNIDIDGRDRDAEGDTWDIGADEYVVNGIEVAPPAASLVASAVTPTTVAGSLSITPAVAVILAAATLTGAVAGSVSITPAAASISVAGVSPTVTPTGTDVSPGKSSVAVHATLSGVQIGSISVTPAAASSEPTCINPTVKLGNVSVSPSAAASASAAVTPSVILSSVTAVPASGVATAPAISPTVILGSTNVTPAAALLTAAAVNPSVRTSSTTASPAAAAIELTASASAAQGAINVSPSPSAMAVSTVTPTVVRGSIAITPTAATALTATTLAGVRQGSLLVVVPATARAVYTGTSPTLSFGSTSVTPSAAQFVTGANANVVIGSISITPSSAVVATSAASPTILAGLEIKPVASIIEVSCPPVTLIFTIDSAALGYWIDGSPDYEANGNVDYEITGRPDYEIGDEI